jgi:tRNA(Ile)-lysidine synthase
MDSVVLLHALLSLREEFRLTLSIAHLDHQIRDDSLLDEIFVKSLAEQFGLAYVSKRVNVPELAQREKRSIEDAARTARYRFLQETAIHCGANKIAIGHTLNDQIETFFMRLLRGSGPAGLCGIPVSRPLNQSQISIIRPLLETSRTQIEAYALEKKLSYREDPSNRNRRFTRNRIRHELLPWLQDEFNPNLIETIARTQTLLHEAHVFLLHVARQECEKLILTRRRGSLVLNRAGFTQLNHFVRRMVLREALVDLHGPASSIGFTHLERAIERLLRNERLRYDFPQSIVLFADKDHMRLSRVWPVPDFTQDLIVPGETTITPIGWKLHCEFPDRAQLSSLIEMTKSAPLEAYLDFDKIKGALQVRRRRTGDRFAPLGLKGTKKLQDFFVDAKIPVEERDRLPLICDERSILWVVGHRVSQEHRVEESTTKILKISASLLEEEDRCS